MASEISEVMLWMVYLDIEDGRVEIDHRKWFILFL